MSELEAQKTLHLIINEFDLPGSLVAVHPYKVGHINETFISVWNVSNKQKRYLHQQINGYVFRDVPAVMQNIERAVSCIKRQATDAKHETLTIVPTRGGGSYLQDDSSNYWRTYDFIEGSVSFEVCTDTRQAFEAARVMGRFLKYLSKANTNDFVETIPNFQNIPLRFKALEDAVKSDAVARVNEAEWEIEFAIKRQKFASLVETLLASGEIPKRVTHSDPKFNNVLFEAMPSGGFGRGLAVVDLDTVMPGTVMYDFGDLTRSVVVSAREDEVDLSKVAINLNLFTELARGYLGEASGLLTRQERLNLHFAPRLVALSLGVRFLTDFLCGDRYFKVHRLNHNLERARTQFRIVQELESAEASMSGIIKDI